jgi:hypothetical protein
MSIQEDLIEYVMEQKTTTESIERIYKFCEQQPSVSLVLYRGHIRSTEIRYNKFWYSATSSKKIAKEEFSSGPCCVFTIHLINVPVIDINQYVGDKIKDYKEEKEYIFLGGGTFYKDKTLKEKGFLNTGSGEFECWYKIDNKQFNLERILDMIPMEEYELIESPTDIFLDGLTEEQKILVFNKIQEIKNLTEQNAGNNTKSKRQSKRQIKRQSKTQSKRQSKKQ